LCNNTRFVSSLSVLVLSCPFQNFNTFNLEYWILMKPVLLSVRQWYVFIFLKHKSRGPILPYYFHSSHSNLACINKETSTRQEQTKNPENNTQLFLFEYRLNYMLYHIIQNEGSKPIPDRLSILVPFKYRHVYTFALISHNPSIYSRSLQRYYFTPNSSLNIVYVCWHCQNQFVFHMTSNHQYSTSKSSCIYKRTSLFSTFTNSLATFNA
jgi:hypothetical protein